MPKVDVKTIIKDLNKNELRNLISVAQEVLSGLFSSDEMTLSPFSNTKLGLDKLLKYCELMILGLSIRQCAEEVDVGVKTSFYMYYRILDVINLSLIHFIVDLKDG